MELRKRGKIKLLIMDIDGTLTDGQVYISASRELFKSFNIKDGYAVRQLLPQYGILPAIITGRSSSIVEKRCRELNIEYIHQGIADKAKEVRHLAHSLNISLEEIACIGDDLNDLAMMQICGLKGCPSDAASDVKAISDYICEKQGGHGAVREFIEWIFEIEDM